jgi:tripartite-type tricarboxylate transporter receptor subunit TctC
MRSKIVRLRILLFVVVAGMLVVGCKREAPYPNHEIEFVIPFAPGGPADTAARIIEPVMRQKLGVPLVLLNKPGAGGALGAEYVKNSPADGYHVLATTNNTLTVLPALDDKLSYRMEDFTPLGSYTSDLSVIASRPDARWRTLDEFVAYARKNPGKLNYGSAGNGTVSFFTMELVRESFGLEITHIPFQGTAPAKTALLGGHVDVTATGFGYVGPDIKAGSLVGLVSTSSQRLADFPDIPTMSEKGFPGASLNIWTGLFVPQGTPEAASAKLRTALEETMKDAGVQKAVRAAGYYVEYRDAQASRQLATEEARMIGATVAKLGLKE